MQIADNPVAFNLINDDWPGNLYEDEHELVTYKNNASMRIWYNHQTHGYSAHWHTALEIILPVENYYDVSTDQADFHIQPGEILVIPPGEMHTLIAKTHSILHSILLQMKDEYFNEGEFTELLITSLLLNFFVRLGNHYRSARNPFPEVQAPKHKVYIQKFSNLLGYIDQHYMENLTLEDMASYAGFSKFHFSRLFKQYTKDTFTDYLNQRRIRAAEELLAAPPPTHQSRKLPCGAGFPAYPPSTGCSSS